MTRKKPSNQKEKQQGRKKETEFTKESDNNYQIDNFKSLPINNYFQ